MPEADGLTALKRIVAATLSKAPGRDSAGKVTAAQVREIAEKKMKDLNCDSIESAMKMVEGSARSMGLDVAG